MKVHDCLKDDMVSSENASAGIICIWKIMFKHQGFEKYMEGYFRSLRKILGKFLGKGLKRNGKVCKNEGTCIEQRKLFHSGMLRRFDSTN